MRSTDDNALWPAGVPLWRKLLCLALLPIAAVSLALIIAAYAVNWGVYRLTCLADGRPGRLSFSQWLRTL